MLAVGACLRKNVKTVFRRYWSKSVSVGIFSGARAGLALLICTLLVPIGMLIKMDIMNVSIVQWLCLSYFRSKLWVILTETMCEIDAYHWVIYPSVKLYC